VSRKNSYSKHSVGFSYWSSHLYHNIWCSQALLNYPRIPDSTKEANTAFSQTSLAHYIVSSIISPGVNLSSLVATTAIATSNNRWFFPTQN
jgi:hypothetical protein